ncbi:hypothetical protein GCM10010361_69110 [Streptomyces olivaceiscleroticus]|uniref:Uncharacterized protein n=1 Tax=Streptomyces olivaceiscleroticus TaxID=68245 RepID=A0ABN1BAZ3_9ACTN
MGEGLPERDSTVAIGIHLGVCGGAECVVVRDMRWCAGTSTERERFYGVRGPTGTREPAHPEGERMARYEYQVGCGSSPVSTKRPTSRRL